MNIKKIIKLNFSFEKKNFFIDKLYIFVGREIINNEKLISTLREIKSIENLSKGHIDILSDEYGDDWRGILGLDLIDKSFDYKKINSGINFNYQKGGKNKIRGEDKKILYTDYSKFDTSDINIDELLAFENEIDKDTEVEIDEMINENEEINLVPSSENKINWIFDTIYDFDNIDTIKKKIFVYTGINYVCQYLFLIKPDDMFKNEFVEDSLGHKIKNKSGNIKFDGILGLENKLKTLHTNEDIVLNVPVDINFINEYYINKNVYISDTNETNVIGNNYDNIFMIDFTSFISSDKFNIVYNELIQNVPKRELYYYGFVLKFFPGISLDSLVHIINRTYVNPFLSKNILNNNFIQEQSQINKLINTREISDSDNNNINSKNGNGIGIKSYITTFITELSNEYGIDNIKINLQQIFQLFELNDKVPYVSLNDKVKNYHKTTNEFYYKNIVAIEKKWKVKEVHGITFRFLLPNSKYGIFIIYDNLSRMEVIINISENYEMSYNDIIKIIHEMVYIEILEKINKMSDKVFVNDMRYNIENININTLDINTSNLIPINESFYLRDFVKFIKKEFNMLFVSDVIDETSSSMNLRFIYGNIISGNFGEKEQRKNIRRSQNEVLSRINNIRYSREGEIKEVFIGKLKAKGILVEFLFNYVKIGGILYMKYLIKGGYNLNNVNLIINIVTKMYNLYVNIHKSNPNDIKKKIKYHHQQQQGNKQIQGLHKVDPKLFNYEKTDEYDSYSRICQKNQQPRIVDKEEADNNTKYSYALALKNKTQEGIINYYVCDHPVYKYPGFIPGEKHPNGYCLPCCYKNSSIERGTRKNRIYKSCLKDLAYAVKGSSVPDDEENIKNIEKNEETNTRYIKEWGKPIQYGRYGYLPFILNKYFNKDENCYTNDLNMIQKNNECYLIAGINQDKLSIFSAIEYSIGYNGNLFKDCIKFLEENEWIFPLLENGYIMYKYNDYLTYIHYLQEGGITSKIKLFDIVDLIKQFLIIKKINIVDNNENYLDNIKNLHFITIVEKENDNMYIECNDIILNNIFENNLPVIFLVNIHNKNHYYPIVHISLKRFNNYSIIVKKIFNDNDNIYKNYKEMIKDLCNYSDRKNKYSNYTNTTNKFVLPNENDMIWFFDKKNIKYKIIEKNIDIPEYGIKLPLGFTSECCGEIYKKDGLKSLVKLLSMINAEFNIEYDISKYVIDKKNNIMGLILNTGNYISFANNSFSSDIKLSKLKENQIFKLNYNIENISKAIQKENNNIPDDRIKNINKINSANDVYNELILRLTKYVLSYKNKNIREKILNILDQYEIKNKITIEQYNKIINDFSKIISEEDVNKIKQLIPIKFEKSYKTFLTLFEQTIFDFDKKIINQLNQIINVNKDINELYTLLKGIILGKDKKNKEYNNYRDDYDNEKLLVRITKELFYNRIVYENLINGRINYIINDFNNFLKTTNYKIITNI